MAADRPWTARTVPFEHPLWVLFSSGTTGVPKGIVHGHGGVILEHLKTLTLHSVLRPGDRFLVVGSTSWVVWNTLVSGLLRGCTIVLLTATRPIPTPAGYGAWPPRRKWPSWAWEPPTSMPACAPGLRPSRDHDLSALRMLHVTGSPLSPTPTRRYDAVGDVWLASVSGGTDVAGIFLGAAPGEPVRVGVLQPPALGVAAQAWDAAGRPVAGGARRTRDHPPRCPPCRCTSGATPTARGTGKATSRPTKVRGGTATRRIRRRRQLRHRRPLRLHAQPQRHPDGARRPLPRGRGDAGGARGPGGRNRGNRTGTTCRSSSNSRRAPIRMVPWPRSVRRSGRRSRPGTCPTTSSRYQRSRTPGRARS